MKIKKIKLENHPVLKDLELDFTGLGGKVNDTIILAGENGTGKTTILDLIYEFSTFQPKHEKSEEIRTFEVELSMEELSPLVNSKDYGHFFVEEMSDINIVIVFDYTINSNWNQIKINFYKSSEKFFTISGDVLHRLNMRGAFISIYSDVEINYNPKEITSVTAKDLDQLRSHSFKSENNLATEITQLLIDIQALDAQEFSQWAKKNIGSQIDESKLDNRIKRFTKAFDAIFPSKKFVGIENRNGNKVVVFEENGSRMTIDQLSSGEKQIVFRGGFLLKDKGVNKGAMILIDEPEISLHPKWQLDILDFYKNIINDGKDFKSQIFISTHSPFIIHNPNRRDDKVIILSKDTGGSIWTLKDPEFYSWTSSRLVKEAFKIHYNFGISKSKLFVEGETDEKYLRKTIDIFDLNSVLAFEVSWIGRINENGGTEFTGDTALNQAKSFFLANSDLLQSKIILLYDNDTNKPEENFTNLFITKMPKNNKSEKFRIGIENLIDFPEKFDYSKFYSEKIKSDEYGAESIIRNLDKTKLCEWICNTSKIEEQKKFLQGLSKILIGLNKRVNQ